MSEEPKSIGGKRIPKPGTVEGLRKAHAKKKKISKTAQQAIDKIRKFQTEINERNAMIYRREQFLKIGYFLRLGFSLYRSCIMYNASQEEEYIKRVKEAYAEKKNPDDVAPADRVDYNTLCKWTAEDTGYPEIREYYESLKTSVSTTAAHIITESIIKDRNKEDAKWWLRHRSSEEFHDQSVVEVKYARPSVEDLCD